MSKRRSLRHSVPRQHNPEDATDRGKNDPESSISVRIDSFPPKPPPSKKEESEKSEQKWLQRVLAMIQVLALLGLIVYVCETRRTNDLTQQVLSENRPWVGVKGDVALSSLTISDDIFRLVASYDLKNFGNTPASNTIVSFGTPMETEQNLAAIRTGVDSSCQSAEDLVRMETGDLLLPSSEKPDTMTWTYKHVYKAKFIVPGCVAYRDKRKVMHHTRLCYWINLSENPVSKTFGTCWFQSAD
jgi:hypothetical protein